MSQELVRRGDFDDVASEVADERIERLERENRQLRRERDDAQVEARRAREDAARALTALRRQLQPLYRALQAVFGEIDAAGLAESMPLDPGSASASASDPRVSAIWQSWKTRLGPQCGKVIDALLLQPGMNTTQLAIAVGTRRQNIPNLIFKLNQAGLIDKNGGRFSLKEL